jgi:hypothetical protein
LYATKVSNIIHLHNSVYKKKLAPKGLIQWGLFLWVEPFITPTGLTLDIERASYKKTASNNPQGENCFCSVIHFSEKIIEHGVMI